ncbi:MAG: helix-turn-helix domain-containing protein [Pseudonocardia sp.]
MTAVRRWTGREAQALRIALRFSVRAFAEHLGVAPRTVSKWEAAGSATFPRPDTQAMLDTVLARADGTARQRFEMSGPPRGRCAACGDERDVPPTGVVGEDEGVNRRELLRLLSAAGAAVALPPVVREFDVDRLAAVAAGIHAPDATAVEEYTRLNAHLWQVFGLVASKRSVLGLVREHAVTLSDSLARSSGHVRTSMCALVADLFQLSGEIYFDSDLYTDAAHCYSLAASAAQGSGNLDLWASALIRHAFIPISEGPRARALPLLDVAGRIAARGNPELSTRYWVAAVRAETRAGLGDAHGCERDLDVAAGVLELGPAAHNGGWLRFAGGRLPEQRGACYVELGQLGKAEAALSQALSSATTARRRACVEIDLAVVGAHRRDHDLVVERLSAALNTARTTGSGVVGTKLRAAAPELSPLLPDRRVRHLSDEIAAHLDREHHTMST